MTTKPTPMQRLSAAHAAAAEDHDVRRTKELASIFELNQRSERLLRIRESDPALFATLGPVARMEVGHYQQQRDAAGYGGDDGDSAA